MILVLYGLHAQSQTSHWGTLWGSLILQSPPYVPALLPTRIQNPSERKDVRVDRMLYVSMCIELGNVLSLTEPHFTYPAN